MNDHTIIQYTDNTRFSLLKDVLNKTANANVDKPFHQNYSTEQSRLNSFKDWPKMLIQQPTDLSNAGFYYYGIKDMVKCFFCNGGLCNWESNDVPIEEHARWFPKCSYLRQLMGAKYLEEMREKFKNVESGFTDNFSYDMTQYYNLTTHEQNTNKTTPARKSTNKEREISPTVVSARLDLPSIRKIIDLGFKKTTVKRAIENKLRKDGDDFKNLVDLVAACYKINENDKKLENKLVKLFDLVLFNVASSINKSEVFNLIKTKINNIQKMFIRLVIILCFLLLIFNIFLFLE
jgi:hypothetical protein